MNNLLYSLAYFMGDVVNTLLHLNPQEGHVMTDFEMLFVVWVFVAVVVVGVRINERK